MLDNTIFQSVGKSPDWFPGRSRFLGLDRSGRAVLMPLDNEQRGPLVVSIQTLQNSLQQGEIVEAASEPFRLLTDLSEAARKDYDAWQPSVSKILEDGGCSKLLESGERARIIIQLARAMDCHENTARRAIYSVMRAGCHLRGLYPEFRKRGGPGRPQKKGTKRRGRKALPGGIRSELALPDIRGVLEQGVSDHIVKNKESVPKALREIIAESFTEKRVAQNGQVVDVERDESRLPTKSQLRHVAKQHAGRQLEKLRSAPAPRPGKAKDHIPGPGYLYEIDATGGRLELVSDFDLQQPIGSANAYGVLDVWSTACVGGVMGVFNAGYVAAQRALFNSFTSKRALFARYDYDLAEDIWPCHHVCRKLAGDRGEMVSDASEELASELNVTLLTAAAYRPQMKGTVERWFHDLKSGDLRKLVGYGRRPERGELDPKARAAMTRYDAMRVFLMLSLKYNLMPAPAEAIPPEMIAMGYEKISRIVLWQWGMRNLVSGARREDPGLIYTSLLKKVDATVREDGLYVQRVRYMSPELRASGLLQKASASGPLSVQATLDDYSGRMIWYRTSPETAWLPATLADDRLAVYDATFQEYVDHYRRRENVRERTAINSAVIDSTLGKAVIAVSNDALARQGAPTSKGKGKGKVRSARSVNAEAERREHGQDVLGSYFRDKPSVNKERDDIALSLDETVSATSRNVDSARQRELAMKSFLDS